MGFQLFLRGAFYVGAMGLVACSQPHSKKSDVSLTSAGASWIATVELANPSNFARIDEPVYLSFYNLGISSRDDLVFIEDKRSLPTEVVDIDGDGEGDGILTVLNFASAQVRQVTVAAGGKKAEPSKRTQAEISIKQGGQWVPRKDGSGYRNYEGGQFVNVDAVRVPDYYTDHSNWIRYEGPGIESDLVGYRIYLDGRNGFDIFGKSIPEPVLQNVGLDGYESYHHPQPWGLDILKVGKSLGAGGFGYWDGKELVHVQKVAERSSRIVENGDLQSSFTIDYRGWQFDGKNVDVAAYFSMQAGSRLAKNQIRLSAELPNLAIGLVAHPNMEFIQGPQEIPGDAYTYIATWGPQSLDGQNLGMAVFFRKGDSKKIFNDGSSHIVLMNPAGSALTYYFAAAWEGELGKGVKTSEEFKQYLTQQTERLTRPLRQRITTRATSQARIAGITADTALGWATKLADSELARKTLNYRYDGWDENRKRKPKFEYDIVGLLPHTYDELARVTGNSRYSDVKNIVTASYIEQDGKIRQYNKRDFNIDAVAPGRALLRVYQENPEPKYRSALQQLREQLRDQPKTSNGAFWHKQIYPGQLWLDGVYMGMPFLAEYASLFENEQEKAKTFEEIVREFYLTREILRDPKTGLYWHAWDEYKQQNWADTKTGLSPHLWARANGWLAMALVDTLDFLPAAHSGREVLLEMTVELAKALKNYQDPTATWWQIMDRPGEVGNYRESSASAMFTYFLVKAVNRGYLTAENYGGDVDQLVMRSYEGLIKEFVLVHPDGRISMVNQCHVAGLGYGRDGSYDYYLNEAIIANDPKGTVPFMLAGIEMHKFLLGKNHD